MAGPKQTVRTDPDAEYKKWQQDNDRREADKILSGQFDDPANLLAQFRAAKEQAAKNKAEREQAQNPAKQAPAKPNS